MRSSLSDQLLLEKREEQNNGNVVSQSVVFSPLCLSGEIKSFE